MWATVPRTELIAIDRQTGELAGRVDLGMQVADEIATGSGAVWATTYSGRVLKVDPDGTSVVAERHVGEDSAADRSAADRDRPRQRVATSIDRRRSA